MYAQVLEIPNSVLRGRLVRTVIYSDVRAFAGKPKRDGAANATGTAGDERDFTG